MDAEEIPRVVGKIRDLFNKGLDMKDASALEEALAISLRLRELIDNQGKEELSKEIAQFHRDRLLSVLRAALPDVSLVAIRFTAEVDADLTGDR